jgi:hypothetical protein
VAQPVIVTPFAVKPTVPLGLGGPAGDTVAVKVTAFPEVEGFRLETKAVVVAIRVLLTICVNEPLLPALLLSPEYVATTASLPTGNVDVMHCATPEESVTDPQPLMVDALAINPTVPDGEAPPLTVAANVTDCPEVDGFGLEVKAVVVVSMLTIWASGELLLPT